MEPFELQHRPGQRLADLVVQLAREPPALVFLGALAIDVFDQAPETRPGPR